MTRYGSSKLPHQLIFPYSFLPKNLSRTDQWLQWSLWRMRKFQSASRSLSQLERTFVAEPVTGYRIWRCVRTEGRWLLSGVYQRTAWDHDVHGNPLQAECLALEPHGRPPHPDCTCGFWLLKSEGEMYARLPEYAHPIAYAFGEVEAWGKIVETEDGYRAQFTRPTKITLVGDEFVRKSVEEAYDCEVELLKLPATVTVPTAGGPLDLLFNSVWILPRLHTWRTGDPWPWYRKAILAVAIPAASGFIVAGIASNAPLFFLSALIWIWVGWAEILRARRTIRDNAAKAEWENQAEDER